VPGEFTKKFEISIDHAPGRETLAGTLVGQAAIVSTEIPIVAQRP